MACLTFFDLITALFLVGAAARLFADLRRSASAAASESTAAPSAESPHATQAQQQAGVVSSLQETRGVYSIFLSHSGKQKGFVERLNNDLLLAGHYPFFDVHCNSVGEPFPERIRQAATHAKVGVVILSDDFMSSKWRMLELDLFTNSSSAKVIPLFYQLSPDDVKSPAKLSEWRKKWEGMAKNDPTIDVSGWEKAVKDLSIVVGFAYKSGESESAYIRKLVKKICEQLPPPCIYDLSYVKGQRRFVQELETQFQLTPIIGMHGVGGLGKTTQSRVMANFYEAHSVKSVVMEFPSCKDDKVSIVKECKKVLKRLSLSNKELLEDVDSFDEVVCLMRKRMNNEAVFLAVDNVWWHSYEEAKRILEVDFGAGSKVLVTSRSEALLKELLEVCDTACVRPIISMNEDEAVETFQASYGADLSLSPRESLNRVVGLCRFNGSYHPLALKALGRKLKNMGRAGDHSAIEKNLARITSNLQKGSEIEELIKINYLGTSSIGQRMFLDVAVIFRRTGSFKWRFGGMDFREMREWLSILYEGECGDDQIDNELQQLALNGLVQFEGEGEERRVVVHDLYVELAELEAAASSRFLMARRKDLEAIRWEELERVVFDDKGEKGSGALSEAAASVRKPTKFLKGTAIGGGRGSTFAESEECGRLRSFDMRLCRSLEEIRGLQSNHERITLLGCASLQKISHDGRNRQGWTSEVALPWKTSTLPTKTPLWPISGSNL